ncbi:hypothetical protein DACRYDRAFT_24548 [Dacryopinax primogenitus]|uniref:Uncharacterized protein n=1 Tax=Dacryopinax primogenitus (strain DJM 731) TaxID=1858805 RepID=M5FPF9_DACPD|nr:uncharacterized protein DACRYDRAFT_24548 [Dacryopinax primogenitus]EJT98530.1 hypothetical protein DACRYDRAFT_24548 [Dacryopinax primogenitus]
MSQHRRFRDSITSSSNSSSLRHIPSSSSSSNNNNNNKTRLSHSPLQGRSLPPQAPPRPLPPLSAQEEVATGERHRLKDRRLILFTPLSLKHRGTTPPRPRHIRPSKSPQMEQAELSQTPVQHRGRSYTVCQHRKTLGSYQEKPLVNTSLL